MKDIDNTVLHLASTCPDSEITMRMPTTWGDICDELIKRGRMLESRDKGEALPMFNTTDINWLRIQVRLDYAREMIEAAGVKDAK
jgi:hypothetical protein